MSKQRLIPSPPPHTHTHTHTHPHTIPSLQHQLVWYLPGLGLPLNLISSVYIVLYCCRDFRCQWGRHTHILRRTYYRSLKLQHAGCELNEWTQPFTLLSFPSLFASPPFPHCNLHVPQEGYSWTAEWFNLDMPDTKTNTVQDRVAKFQEFQTVHGN